MKKVALITGGTRGIGYGIAEALAEEGWSLALCATREESHYHEQIGRLRRHGCGVLYCQCDIAETDDRNRLLHAVIAEYGQLNALVNNAGIAPPVRADMLSASEESFAKVIRINLQGPYFLTQLIANYMIEQKNNEPLTQCRIVNISSVSAIMASTNRGEYCVAKAVVGMATRLWAVRLAEFGIPVFEIRPGIIKTDMTAGVREKYDRLIGDGLCLQSRWGLPEDVGRAAAMLLRGDVDYSTGQVINVEGGMTVPRL